MNKHKLALEEVTLKYEVTNYQNEILRKGQVTGTFPIRMPYADIIDALHDIAYDMEDCSSTSDDGSYSIMNE